MTVLARHNFFRSYDAIGSQSDVTDFRILFRPVSTTGQTAILSILIIVSGFDRTRAAMSLVE